MISVVYILHFPETDRYYVGSSNNLKRRLNQHRLGHTHSTKRLGNNFRLVFTQELSDLVTARQVEYRIKSWKRRDYIEQIVKDGKIKFLEKDVHP